MGAQSTNIHIMVVDDHALLRQGVTGLVSSQADMVVVGEAATGAAAIALHEQCNPHVTVIDLALPDMSGIEVISAIRQRSPRARFVVLTTFRGDVQAVRALKAGATGYLLKSMLRPDLLHTIRVVHEGGKRIPDEIAQAIADNATGEALSEREIEVLRWVAEGCSNKVVAGKLAITEDTVKSHVRTILAKLAAKDRTHAVTIATRRGFLDLDR
jgi:DNA-binding NarL/FixJ family response regulator